MATELELTYPLEMPKPRQIRRYAPGYVDPFSDLCPITLWAYIDLEDLKTIPWIKKSWLGDDLDHFSVTIDSPTTGGYLMAEMKNGTFWVVGRLNADHGLDLPQWKAPRKAV